MVRRANIAVLAWVSVVAGGCAVPQPGGKGQWFVKYEARHGMSYYLYLPQDYVESEGKRAPEKKWPMVVSFHGMRPWDSAGAQIMEWQQEADRYGYVVIAPSLRVSDLLGELAPHRVSSSMKADERDVLAILDEVTANYAVDPHYVLSTSWSMGGYIAHYMVNRHPERFSCLAVRQSNFSADILDPAQVPKYRGHRIAVFYTKHDFNICQKESQEAIAWYRQYGFDITAGVVDNMGHERTPEVAAAFFAETCGAAARTPPTELAMRITIEPTPVAPITTAPTSNRPDVATAPRSSQDSRVAITPSRPVGAQPVSPKTGVKETGGYPPAGGVKPKPTPSSSNKSTAGSLPTARKTTLPPARTNTGSAPRIQPLPTQTIDMTQKIAPSVEAAVGTKSPTTAPAKTNNPLNVKLSAYIGISPMLISYTVQMPAEMMKDADVLWLDNGQPISRGVSGQKSLLEPGQHRIEALAVTSDNQEYRASKTVTVLERLAIDDDDSP